MGELKNCKKCGRMFSAENGQLFCSKCRTNDEDDFKVVREYIYDNPNSTVHDVHEATEVSEEKILKFLRQGRLILKGEGVGLECERCGKSINTGRFCDKCAHELKSGFQQAFGGEEKKEAPASNAKKGAGMHIKKY
ncbi:MAG: MerR family transcriptional regulator [Clostridia bacterium]|nr:MerR family transcriptional regulator [Clostridia bacterium]